MSDKTNKRRNVLITGGTKGLGLATALRFAREGDQCIITYGWGSVEDDEILDLFRAENLPLPYLRQADVINDEDTEGLIKEVFEKFGTIDVFISNVSFASLVKGFDGYSEKMLLKSIEYSSWPLIAYTRKIEEVTGHYPKYVIAYSSHGPDGYHSNYDFAAVTKSVLEVLIRYLNYHFFDKEVIFNIVRTRPVITDSLLSTMGKEWEQFIERFDIPGTDISLDEFAKVVITLCSGYMDGIRGQTIIADKGYDFADGLQYLFTERERLGLT
jgi:NAD(P)-dependent dehydrogenase (short-subunit alcohol dehydrogenase family)